MRGAERLGRWVLLALLFSTACASLTKATRTQDVDKVKEMIASGADPNEMSFNEYPLCAAVVDADPSQQKNVEIITMLLEAGADPNVVCEQPGEHTLLEHAAISGDVVIFKLLLAHHASSFGGKTPLLKLMSGKRRVGITDAYLAHIERVHGRRTMLRVANGHYPKQNYPTPIARAAFDGDEVVVRELLWRGVSPNAVSGGEHAGDDRWPILYFALIGRAKHQHGTAVERALLSAGANPKAKSKLGHTFDEAWIAWNEAVRAEEERLAYERVENRRREREEEADKQRENEAAWNAFSSGLAGGGAAGGSSQQTTNPVQDDSFQKRMRGIANQYPKAPTLSTPPPRRDPSLTVAPTTSPPNPPGPTESSPSRPSSPNKPAQAKPPAQQPSEVCTEIPAPRDTIIFRGETRASVKADILTHAREMCKDAGGETINTNAQSCSEIVKGHIECKVEIVCNAPRKVCSKPTGGQGTQQ